MPVTLANRAVVTVAARAALLVFASLLPGPSGAESAVALEAPRETGNLPATTFDVDGRAIGQSTFEVQSADAAAPSMRVVLNVEGGGSNFAEARFQPVLPAAAVAAGAAGRTSAGRASAVTALRVVEERSQSTSADGRVFPLLVIDHERRRISCYPDGEPESAALHRDIPDGDRVVNVPMQLLFLPLVRGEVDSIDFQIATCSEGKPDLYDMIAVKSAIFERDGRRIVEIEYGPDFGATIAFFASRLLPSFSFWFDADDGSYLGHRMPLHLKGPEVTLVRQGLTPAAIGAD